MILSSILVGSLVSAQPTNEPGPLVIHCPPGEGLANCAAKSAVSQALPWFLAARAEPASPFMWDRGVPVLARRWSRSLQGPVSAKLAVRPVQSTDPDGFLSALVGTHTGRVLLLEWDRSHSRVAASWNVDGMVLGAPAWLDGDRFVVGTDADSLHGFVRSGAKAQWRRHVGRCPHRRALGPMGSRCDLGQSFSWQPERTQVLAASDGVYALDPKGRMRWQWPAGGGLANALASPVISDKQGNSYFADRHGHAISLDPQGTLRWTARLGAKVRVSPLLVGQHRVCFFADNAKLHCLHRADGSSLWSFKAPARPLGPMLSSPGRGKIWAASADGSVFALNSWGQKIWRRKVKALGAQGLMARSDGELLVLVGRRKRTALGIDRDSGRLLWQARLGLGDPGQMALAGDRWLLALRPQGVLDGYWLPPAQGKALRAQARQRLAR